MTTRTVEHGGSTIEVTETGGEWYVAIDGEEMAHSYATASHALDAARRRVTRQNRAQFDRPRTVTPMAEVDAVRAFLRSALEEVGR